MFRKLSFVNINEARLELFVRKQQSYDSIPPTCEALVEQKKRVMYIARFIWGQSVSCFMVIRDPGEFGWIKKGDSWQIFWIKLESISESFQKLTICGCKSECSGRWKYIKLSLSSTALWSCKCLI